MAQSQASSTEGKCLLRRDRSGYSHQASPLHLGVCPWTSPSTLRSPGSIMYKMGDNDACLMGRWIWQVIR